MTLADEFRAALAAGDIAWLRRFWAEVMPDMPQPESDADAEIVMHRARTEAASLPLKARAWSHRWIEERSYPSGLPDELRPKAERIYPVKAEGVLISVNARNPYLKPAAIEIRRAMEDAVNDAYAEGRTEPAFVRQRMEEARGRAYRQLLG